MRICLVHGLVGGAAAGGGGSRLMLELGLGLLELGHEVVVACHDFQPGTEFADASKHLEIRAVRTGSFSIPGGKRAAMRRFWLEMPKVADLVPDETEVINAHEWPASHAARLAAKRLDVPYVWTRNDHTIFERAVLPGARNDSTPSLLRRIPRALGSLGDLVDARKAAAIVTLDEQSAEMVRRAYRRDATVLRCGPSNHFFDPPPRAEARHRLAVAGDDFLVLGVGILTPHRRFEDLIQAVALLESDRMRVEIIGSDHVEPGYADALAGQIARSGLQETVRLMRDGAPESHLRDAYVAADVFVFPNDSRQSWGLAPLEALASGTPVIITTGPGVHEVLTGRAGVTVVPEHSPDELARAISAHMGAGRRAAVQPTRDWLDQELSYAAYAARTASLFEQAILTHR
jgi:glycosyltransferase involved in cell wall biosynthesis